MLLVAPVWAQTAPWPLAQPVHLVVAYPAGGVSDGVARALAEQLGQRLGASFVVENRGGASGSIAMEQLARAVPDGYSLVFSATSPLTLNPHLQTQNFDPSRDIAPVASVMDSPILVLATKASNASSFADLIATAKAQPGVVRWATSGAGSVGHLMLEQVAASSGARFTHVPYKGGGQQMTDALGGQFEVTTVNANPALLLQVQAGHLRALAVGATRRLASLPNVPTLAELGFGSANMQSGFGVFAPAQTPPAVVRRLNAAINQVLATPSFRQRLEASGNLVDSETTADFAKRIVQESANNARIVQAAGIHGD